MWTLFLKDFNGKSLFLPDRFLTSDSLNLFTDASGSLGYGAVFGSKWLSGTWNDLWRSRSITLLELYPIVLAVELWGESLANKCLSFYTDNLALVDILNKQTSKDRLIMTLLRRLVLSCLQLNLVFQAVHIPGKDNTLADLLSRLQVDKFKRLAPWADSDPVQVPPLPCLNL